MRFSWITGHSTGNGLGRLIALPVTFGSLVKMDERIFSTIIGKINCNI